MKKPFFIVLLFLGCLTVWADNTVTVSYNGTTATVTVDDNVAQYLTVTQSGAHVSIAQSSAVTEEITYTLTGTSSDGEFYMSGSFKATIELNGLTLTNTTPVYSGAAIHIQNSKRINVKVVTGTTNTLVDVANGSQKGCLYVKGHAEFKQQGTLTVVGNTKHGIKAGEYISVKNATINVTSAVDDGISCNQYFLMESGTINISGTGDDGIQCDLDGETSTGMINDHEGEDSGNVYITGGNLTINCPGIAAKGIKSAGDISISGTPVVNITTSGKGEWDTTDLETNAACCLSADRNIDISGGVISVTSTGSGGKGMKCDTLLTISGGNITVKTTGNLYYNNGTTENTNYSSNTEHIDGSYYSSPKGIKAGTKITSGSTTTYYGGIEISGGVLNVTTTGNNAEGIESKNYLTITGGELMVDAHDDGINAAQDLTIEDGYVYSRGSNNDGIDANGNVYINGGLIYAIGASSPEVGIDANSEENKKFYFTGGTLIAIGGLEQGSSLSQSCYQTSSWSTNTWYSMSFGSTVIAFKTPSSGGSSMVVSASSTPTLKSGVTVNGGTYIFEERCVLDPVLSGGSNVTLSDYSGGGFGPGPGPGQNSYTITATANPTTGGTVTGAGTYNRYATCTLRATPNSGYTFTNWTKNGSTVSTNATYSFQVTANAAYVANFAAQTAYPITCQPSENGTITADKTSAYQGETVTLTAVPDPGFYLGTLTVKDGSNNNITVTNNQFVMPNSPVTVSATFGPGYLVTLASVMNGTISASPTLCAEGATVTLTATPVTGYVFDSWVVYKTGDVNTTIAVNGNSFTMPAYDVTVAGIFTEPQGGDVTIGSGNSTGYNLPTTDYYNYSLTQQIYTASELGEAGTITAISFYYSTSTNSKARSLEVYMRHTTSSTITSWVTESSSNLVYSGTHTFTQGWNLITLTTPFVYNGTSNLLLTVDDNTGSWGTNSQFRTYSTNANRAIYYRNDNNNPSATGTNSYSPTTLQVNAQMTVTKEVPGTEPSFAVSPSTLSGFTYPEGEGPSEAQAIAVIGRNMEAALTLAAPADYEVSLTENGSFANTLSLTPSNGNIQTMVYVRLKEGLVEGDYNGETLSFTTGTATQEVSLNGEVIPGAVVNFYFITTSANPTDAGTVTGAGRYREGSTVTLTATANTGYTFTKWTKGGVQVSTEASYAITVTENADYVAVFTLNSYSVMAAANPTAGGNVTGSGTYNHGTSCTLTATSNTGYTFTRWTKNGVEVATDATYTFTVTEEAVYEAMFTLNSYNVTATADPEDGGTITGTGSYNYGTTATLIATANDAFLFEGWFENGTALSSENTLSFTVENNRTLVARFIPIAHQTQTFNIGWGWVSFYVDLNSVGGIQLLEQALGEDGIMIKSHNDGFVSYENGLWNGTLNTIEVEQMYQINASNNDTLSLDAVVVDPADHPITIQNGWNWIGYPSTTETTVANAFSTFPTNNEDVLKSHDAMATYIEGYGWWGTLGKMTPGCGYMYNSKADDDNTLVYAQGTRGTAMHTANNDNLHWNAVAADFNNNASIIATIDAKDFTLSESTELGAFVDGECRGATRLLYVEPLGQYLAFLTVFGNDDEQMDFRVYDDGNSYSMEEQLVYKNNLIAGNAYQPVVLHQNTNSSLVLYPNPVKAGEEVYINLSETFTMEIIDAMGRVVMREDAMYRDAMHCVSTGGMAPGFYTIHIICDYKNHIYEKLIIK